MTDPTIAAWSRENDLLFQLRQLREAIKNPVLQDSEQYRMQMAAICTAAIGCWTEYDSICPDYDTLALRDVAKFYTKYDELYKAQLAQPEQEPHNFCPRCGKRTPDLTTIHTCTPPKREWVGLTDEEISVTSKGHIVRSTYARAIEAALKEKNFD